LHNYYNYYTLVMVQLVGVEEDLNLGFLHLGFKHVLLPLQVL
jgi:hypothetical protein